MKTTTRTRNVYRVQHKGWLAGWCVLKARPRRDGNTLLCAGYPTQREAVREAVSTARSDWLMHARPAQVILHGRNGRIQWERTYGRDPKRRKG